MLKFLRVSDVLHVLLFLLRPVLQHVSTGTSIQEATYVRTVQINTVRIASSALNQYAQNAHTLQIKYWQLILSVVLHLLVHFPTVFNVTQWQEVKDAIYAISTLLLDQIISVPLLLALFHIVTTVRRLSVSTVTPETLYLAISRPVILVALTLTVLLV